jgi:hypothetical protein
MDDSTQRQEDHPEQGAGRTRLAAEEYALRGWSTVPVPYRSKNPGFKDWEQLRVTQETIGRFFNGQPQNIGVLLGEPSGWLIDVDLDHRRAVELAAEFLPPTPAKFGRPGKLLSHWIYRTTGPVTAVTAVATNRLQSERPAPFARPPTPPAGRAARRSCGVRGAAQGADNGAS